YHHFGDAFMTIYSEVPESLTVSHANAMVPNSGSFSVTANDGSLIALTVDGEIIGVDEGTGSPVSISIEQQSAGETVTITVTMANYYRYEEDITTSGLTGNVYNGSGGPLLAANSPYYLLGDITVPQAESLTVNAGVEVIFGDGDMITADGVLKADGTQVNPISFLDDANETKKILKGDFILKNGGECKVP
ncbi:MAG: hypothetical protein GY855_12140, partial [candidate division Zixibacteria bacterium]|nr:hypothetical protein [candidate division Zixibacteria bacterium]